ncbi:hypothetical protein KIN20_007401 [Parelaphostrongylus tenuis]|uniref:Uncharacterized protein n=1 Tax=Parelaphostrongylus tenuis TaxID=148309 RepID=A0AAD5M3D4_PARTN|nr:hypothetical protein KIN20_007401 [Parelaphostrongylus tenuis]
MATYTTYCFMISLLAMILTVSGCGVIPTGQVSQNTVPARTRTFKVSGFTLPVAMVYSAAPEVRARVTAIAADMIEAHAFVARLVMHIFAFQVLDVLESHARSALLPDAVISAILDQHTFNITYTSMQCPKVHLGLTDENNRERS